jgi:cell division septum initiation protein DivIVA
MADPKEALKKKIEDLKAQLAKEKAAGKTSNKDLGVRKLHKNLRRCQRKLSLLSPLSYEQKVARVSKLTDLVAKRMSELTQGAKKVQANPYVHSLRKKTKSLTKRKKKLDRIGKKMAAAAKPAAAPAPAPTAPAAEPEKK